MDPHHQFQRTAVTQLGLKPIVNIACMHDPARLGADFGAINTDVRTYDAHSGTDLKKSVPNFLLCSAFDLPFEDKAFGVVVLGEYLEHCTREAAIKSLNQARRVMRDDGRLVLSFPLDDRPKDVQHAAHLLVEWSNGITAWHQTVWEDFMLEDIFRETKLDVVSRTKLEYGFAPRGGWGMVLKKC